MNAVQAAVDKALELQPESAEAYLALADYHYRCHRDYVQAIKALSMAEKDLPNNAQVLELKGAIQRRKGKIEQAVESFKDDKPISDKPYGLDSPQLKVTVQTEQEIPPKARPGDPDTQPADTQPSMESKSYVLMVGGATDTKGETFFARIGTAPWVFSIRSDTYKNLSPTPTELRDKTIDECIALVEGWNVMDRCNASLSEGLQGLKFWSRALKSELGEGGSNES